MTLALQKTDMASSLTYEQKEMLGRLRFDLKAEDELSEACQYVAKGDDGEAMNILEGIEWRNTSVKVSKMGVNKSENEQIIDFFKRHPSLDKDSCNQYASEFFNDALQ
ncbi:hypothetical protein [Escherichia coli]|uniref:hypothetical protein n=1 Tax=Escherichia coli TaxID=562 RepID=UPI00191A4122|nr:hypothetical protein [Escherichia coli]